MRATMSGYYRNLQFDQSKVAKELFDVTKQISSGQQIQYAHEDVSTFVDTVRLDNEVTTLTQIKQNAQKALQVSTNTDTTMNDMTKILDAMKVQLVSAANESHSHESLNAIALELRGLEKNLVQLANTSIDGKFLFSGSETSTKPIDVNGLYQGNDDDINTFLGSGVEQKYNINGADLFLGDENDTQRKISLNMPQLNQAQLFPDVMIDPARARTEAKEEYISESSTIRDIMGDTDTLIDLANPKHFFYIRGTQSDGTAFKEQIAMSDEETVAELLNRIGTALGNTPQGDVVNISLNKNGQIEIEDKFKGSSKLDFHMVAATDFTGGIAANVADIDLLDDGETNLEFILDATSTAINPNLYVKSFQQSGLSPSGTATNIEALKYGRVEFDVNGSSLSSNVAQILTADNSVAEDSTRLSEVFDTIVLGTSVLRLEGLQADGVTPYGVDIDLNNPVTVAGSLNFTVLDAQGVATNADDMTYRQLMDAINFVVTGTNPGVTAASYSAALTTVDAISNVSLDESGKIVYQELNVVSTNTTLSLYDDNTNDFTNTTGAIANFNANNALTISDPKTDFFKQIDEAIKSVELGRIRADGSLNDARSGGVQNAIQALDDLSEHMFNQHSIAGVQSQTLQTTEDRTDLLIITTKTLRSETLDVDIAEASLELQQLTLNYQAMLSTVSRVTQLSLVNYL